MEAIKLVAGVGETLAGRLMLFDALASRWHEVRLARDPQLPRVRRDARAPPEENA
jgi:adenylyltransferase/sulfurtransferase